MAMNRKLLKSIIVHLYNKLLWSHNKNLMKCYSNAKTTGLHYKNKEQTVKVCTVCYLRRKYRQTYILTYSFSLSPQNDK